MINCYLTFWWRPSRNRILENSLATYFYLIKYIWVAWKPIPFVDKKFWKLYCVTHLKYTNTIFSVQFSWVGKPWGIDWIQFFLYYLIHSSIKDERCNLAIETAHVPILVGNLPKIPETALIADFFTSMLIVDSIVNQK